MKKNVLLFRSWMIMGCYFILNCSFSQNLQSVNLILSDTVQNDQGMIKRLIEKINPESDDRIIIHNFYKNAYGLGYLSAEADSVKRDSNQVTLFATMGVAYKWTEFRVDSLDLNILKNSGVKAFRNNQKYSIEEWNLFCNNILIYLENNGYPFAAVMLDDSKVDNGGITGDLKIEKGPLYYIDSLDVRGDAKMSEKLIARIANFKAGMIYNEAAMGDMIAYFEVSPLCRLTEPPRVEFYEKYAKLILYVKSQKSSFVDGMLGVIPDNSGKIQLTGDVSLKLKNVLKYAEEFNLRWKKSGEYSQDLKTMLAFPFLFNSPYGIGVDLSIFKKDSSYLSVMQKVSFLYSFGRENRINVSVESRESSVLIDRLVLDKSMMDSRLLMSSVGGVFGFIDHPVVPTKGYRGHLSLGAGKRELSRKFNVNSEFYDSIPQTFRHYEMQFSFENYLKLTGRVVWYSEWEMEYVVEDVFYVNDAIRIGGVKSIRGFDEESILATKYGVLKNEFRWMMDRSSYLYVLADVGGCEADFENYNKSQKLLYGIGAGLAFETPVGLFSINYALGRDNVNPFVLKNAKIHFGILNHF